MKWRDSQGSNPAEGEPVEDYLDEETYSPWKKGSNDGLFSMLAKRPLLPYILAAVGVVLLIVATGSLFSSSGTGASDEKILALEERIVQMEQQLDNVEDLFVSADQINALEKKNDQLRGRFDRMEAALAMRMDHISKKLDGMRSAPVVAAPAKKTVRKPPAKPAARPTGRYYAVKAGDTLYSISRKYGLTVGQLRQLNKLSPDQAIHPGDKLLVSR